jgi:LDH2 family malate/lactate/ureidoglycolate dehydrogenase
MNSHASGGPHGVEEHVSAAVIPCYRFDDVRRFAAALAMACGLTPARALALASHLLWFDGAGAPTLGIATLPGWLEAIEAGRVDPAVAGRVITERSSLAIVDGQNGLPPLLLERAAELAVEKAREAAVGLVRVSHLGEFRSAAAVTAGIAVGPMAGLALGPGRLWSMAVPSEAGLPFVVDSGLSTADANGKHGAGRSATDSSRQPASRRDLPSSALLHGLGLGAAVLVPEDCWLVAAVSVLALEPLATFHERVAQALRGVAGTPGRLLPDLWDRRRRDAHEHGVAIPEPAAKSLKTWAQRLAVEPPTPLPR